MSDRRSRVKRANTPIGRALRYVGLFVGIVLGWQFGTLVHERAGEPAGGDAYALLFAATVGALFFLVTPYLTLSFFGWLRDEFLRLSVADLLAVAVGLVIGGLISSLLAWPVSLLPGIFGQVLPALAAVIVCCLAVVAVVTKKRELISLIRRGERTEDDTPQSEPRRAILVDTSVIIDGRIAELAKTGFLMADLVVPQFVLNELHLVADSEDASRRERGRRGLDTLERLRGSELARLDLSDLDAPDERDVDSKLVRLARLHGLPILTGDQNLERIGNLHGVHVINIHQLAHALRPPLIPGEDLLLKITQAGKEYNQGVGFLDDGTMVVVEDGKSLIGQSVPVVVTRTIQTGAGRMAFAQRARNQEPV